MKRILIIALVFMMAATLYAQEETIIDPNANVTITHDQIVKMGQNHSSVNRDVIILDFEGLGNSDPINGFYNGGTSGGGYSGTNYGVEFSSNALGLIDGDAGGSGNFANEPSPSTIMFFSAGSPYMNVASGFTTGFSFYYTSNSSFSVNVYDGLNGTGNLLATANFPANHNLNCTGDPGGSFCNFDAVGVGFSGTAYSVVFGGAFGGTGYDDITFGSITPGEPLPISNWALFIGIGMMLMFAIFRIWKITR